MVGPQTLNLSILVRIQVPEHKICLTARLDEAGMVEPRRIGPQTLNLSILVPCPQCHFSKRGRRGIQVGQLASFLPMTLDK